MDLQDTIVAISSTAAPGARIIVRLSGDQASAIAARLSPDIAQLVDRSAKRVMLDVQGVCVPAWVYRFGNGHSYTGQEMIELHLPGNPLLARLAMERCLAEGARGAEPGEFTARAFFAGRLDLSQAEGVAAVIASSNEQELSAARQLLAGELARQLRPAMDALSDALARVEAGIDFSDQGIEFVSGTELRAGVAKAMQMLQGLLAGSEPIDRLSHEPTIVLAGRPNAGKSTLVNALAGFSRSIISPLAGTTRDVLSVPIALRRGVATLLDAAGLDDEPADLAISIDSQMRQRALQAIERADVVVHVRECNDRREPIAMIRPVSMHVITKIDLLGPANRKIPPDELAISALTGENIDVLRERLDTIAFGSSRSSALALTARHTGQIEAAIASLRDALQSIDAGGEFVAADLRLALDCLGSILGSVTEDDILGKIFSSFCIGK